MACTPMYPLTLLHCSMLYSVVSGQAHERWRAASRTLRMLSDTLMADLLLCNSYSVITSQVGARGADEQGAIFASSLKRSSVDVKKLRVGRGVTGTVTR